MSQDDFTYPVEKWTCEEAAIAISNAAYQALGIFADLENAGKIWGNGHHNRQRIAKAAADLVRERWREER